MMDGGYVMKYKLFNQNLTAIINSYGAELKSLAKGEIEYIWPGNSNLWNRSSPVLFPIVGSLKNKQTKIFDSIYRMNQHGFLRDQEFTLVSQESSKIILEFISNEETYQMYPFKFKVQIIHELNNNSLTTTFMVFNLDEKEMFFNIGGHPGFCCPLYPGEKFTDYRIEFEKAETFSSPTVESDATLNFDVPYQTFKNLEVLHLDYEYFIVDAIVIPKVSSSYVKLLSKNNRGIKFDFKDFSSFAIWTHPAQAPFVCLEPWIGYADRFDSDGNFESKADLIYLQPNQTFSCSYTIEII